MLSVQRGHKKDSRVPTEFSAWITTPFSIFIMAVGVAAVKVKVPDIVMLVGVAMAPDKVKPTKVGLEVVATVWLIPSKKAHSEVVSVFAPIAIEVAVAAPKVGVVKDGLVAKARTVPVPVVVK